MLQQRKTRFDKRLLHHIISGRNDEAEAMLNEELAQTIDDSAINGTSQSSFLTLLHYAVQYNNPVIAQKLIELGADVDRFVGRSTTPLMTAVLYDSAAVIKVLLEANARIDIIDDNGSSALQVALDWTHVNFKSAELLVGKLRREAGSSDEVAEILIRAGCNMSHAATLRDLDVMECMLKRGVDVNSSDLGGMTALHVAVFLKNMNLADWLVEKGVDMDALDNDKRSALMRSVDRGDKATVQWLLEHGAFLKIKDDSRLSTFPLFKALHCFVVHKTSGGSEKFLVCAELLLQHGATLQDSTFILKMLQYTLMFECYEAVNLFIAHLAMLEKLGQPVAKSVILLSVDVSQRAKMSDLLEYYEPCQQVLLMKMFENCLLLDLLKENDDEMRLLVRKETFLQEVERMSTEHELKKLYSYYYNSMMRRVEKASRVVKLEDEAILMICKLFEVNYNQFYDFARGVVEYLSEYNLQILVQV